MTQDKFLIKTESFEGPLDLLLSLIEKRKLLINEISLSQITDEYIEYVKSSVNLSLQKNTNFILIASTLVLIKSKSLLPTLDLTREEEENIDELEIRLKVYKRIKETEKYLSDMFNATPKFFKKDVVNTEVTFAPANNISLDNLRQNIYDIISSLPKVDHLPKKIVQKVISLEEMIGNLTNRIQQNINMSFKEFSNQGKTEKVNVVVSFLAMLELVKEGIIEVAQNNQYGDIDMQSKDGGIPNYS